MANNKVKFGLKNVFVSKVTETVDPITGATTSTYGTPKAWTGAVNLTLDANGSDDSNFDADDGVYYVIQGSNNGYTGSYESALVPEFVMTDLLGYTTDGDGVLVESKDDQRSYFAMTFEVDGDVEKRRYVFYRCLLGRLSTNASTKTSDGGNTPQTDTVNITITPRPDDGLVKCRTGSTTSSATYNAWNSSIYIPTSASGAIVLSASTITMSDTDTAVVNITASPDSLYENMTATVTEGASVDVDMSFDNKSVIVTPLTTGTSTVTVSSGLVSATFSVTVEA